MRYRNRRLTDERGQALVIFVVVLATAALLVQVVTDGGWLLGAQRQTQAIADAAALAAVQEFPFGDPIAAGEEYAKANLGGADADVLVSADPANASVSVNVARDVDGLFGVLVGDFEITAHARAGAPRSLDNAELSSLPVAPSWVVPLVLSTGVCDGSMPWPSSCFEKNKKLRMDAADSSDTFALACLSGSCDDVEDEELAAWITCSPCLGGEISVGSGVTALDEEDLDCDDEVPAEPGDGKKKKKRVCEVLTEALESLSSDQIVVVPVVDSIEGDTAIQGFAALRITGVGKWKGEGKGNKSITIKLTKYTAGDSRKLEIDPDNPIFGVRVFGLTS